MHDKDEPDRGTVLTANQLRRELRQAGVANAAVDAVWPEWWSADAANSMSATAELTYTVARRLGMSPTALFDGSPEFLWRDETKFKNLGTTSEREQAILASFGTAVGRCAIRATPVEGSLAELPDLAHVREIILAAAQFVELREILNLCWAIRIPVIQLEVFALRQKRMQAMTVRLEDRHAILLGRQSSFYAQTAFVIGHELAHIALGHLANDTNLLDIEDLLTTSEKDGEEIDADHEALMLLTGDRDPQVVPDADQFTGQQLVKAALQASAGGRIEPGTLALCAGYATKRWPQTFAALRGLPPGRQNVGQQINDLATSQFSWSELSYGNRQYLAQVIGRDYAAA